jgi:hypothetical protein
MDNERQVLVMNEVLAQPPSVDGPAAPSKPNNISPRVRQIRRHPHSLLIYRAEMTASMRRTNVAAAPTCAVFTKKISCGMRTNALESRTAPLFRTRHQTTPDLPP